MALFDDLDAFVNIIKEGQLNDLRAFKVDHHKKVKDFVHLLVWKCLDIYFV